MAQTPFGNPELHKVAERFGASQGNVSVELKHTQAVQAFIQKLELAQKATAQSSLLFR